MLGQNLTNLCFDIFAQLDSTSITNCRLVCHKWKFFIDEYIYGSRKGRLCLQQKITANFLNENFQPRLISKIPLNEDIEGFEQYENTEWDSFRNIRICYMALDEDNIFIGTYKGYLLNFDFHTLKLLWVKSYGEYSGCEIYISEKKVFRIMYNNTLQYQTIRYSTPYYNLTCYKRLI